MTPYDPRSMTTLPQRFYRVEWQAARALDRPHERRDRARNFTTAAAAAAQVRAIASWPTHMNLTGVYYAAAVWRDVDVATLPAVPDEVERRFAALEAARDGRAVPYVEDVYDVFDDHDD